jgi:hypothetical protein
MQRARSKFALPAGAALTLALLAFIAWQWSARSSAGGVDAAAPIGIGPLAHDQAELRALQPLPTPIESTRSEAIAVQNAPAAEHVAADDQHFATVVLKGAIDSDRDDLQLALVFVRPLLSGEESDFSRGVKQSSPLPHLEANARADGNFDFDVTRLVQIPGIEQLAHTLSVTVVHPTLANVTEQVSVPSVERLHREARIELTVVVHMTQTMVRLLGRAWTVDGAQTTIQVVAIDVSGADSEDTVSFGMSVAKDNSFALDVRAPGEYAVVAIADGYRPGTQRVSVKPGGDITLPPLVLDHGHTIRGRVNFGPRNSLAGATVAAQPAGSFTRAQVAGKSLACFDDGFEWATRSARVDASGGYELSELGPRAYSVSTSGVEGAYLGQSKSHEFVAPCTGADLTLGSVCEVHVAFHGADQPKRTHFGVRQQFSSGGTGYGSQESAADGRVTLFIEPGVTTTIEVADRTFPVPACVSGGVVEMRVDL